MERTPPRSKLSCKSIKLKKENKLDNIPQFVTCTPTIKTNLISDQEDDYSPVYFPTTQETNEDIDVLWDWHSPQSSERQRKKQKRLIPVHSPNVPIKRHPSNNNQTFEKLRGELKLLQEELAIPDDESCLCVSPQQEMDFKDDKGSNNSLHSEKEQFDNFDDIFNDSVNEQLVLFSQKIENGILKEQYDTVEASKYDVFNSDDADIDNLIKKYTENNCDKFSSKTYAEQNNFHMEDVKNPDFCQFSLQKTLSVNHFNNDAQNIIQTLSGKLELHRTKSFELEANKLSQVSIPKCKLEEIERKRLEAVAKLTLKKKTVNTNKILDSPSKCSPEEIEKKRLQALAKREAKRLEEIVEKKRQDALKKLQASRMKNANLVKSTLTTRL